MNERPKSILYKLESNYLNNYLGKTTFRSANVKYVKDKALKIILKNIDEISEKIIFHLIEKTTEIKNILCIRKIQ